MSVFTKVGSDDIRAWLENYSIGTLLEMRGIAEGIENTNYFLTTTQGRYVLTLFERLSFVELPFYLGLMAHLACRGIACPAPVADRSKALFSLLMGKPATVVTRLPGAPVMVPLARHCAQVGETLARMHVAAQSYQVRQENPRGPQWWRETAPRVLPFLDPAQAALLESELEYHSCEGDFTLPRGPIHADLFRDNVLFHGEPGSEEIGGVIDFYFAGVDALLFDVAVVLNDWCVEKDGGIDDHRAAALLAAYRKIREFTPQELAAWPAMLRAAALRFWLSRLYDFYCPRPGELTHAHDPEHFRRILELRRAAVLPLQPAA